MRALVLTACAVLLAGLAGYALQGSLQLWAGAASLGSLALAVR